MKIGTFIWLLIGLIAIVAYGYFDPEVYKFPTCPFRALTGWLCPGCGSQRAIHQVLHGNIAASIKLNPLLLPGFLYALISFITSYFFPSSWPYIRQTYYGLKAGYVSLIVILVFWVVRNIV